MNRSDEETIAAAAALFNDQPSERRETRPAKRRRGALGAAAALWNGRPVDRPIADAGVVDRLPARPPPVLLPAEPTLVEAVQPTVDEIALATAVEEAEIDTLPGSVEWGQLDVAALAPGVRKVPERGWQRHVHRMSFGAVTPAPSDLEQSLRDAEELVASTPLGGQRRIAVLSEKGGVGKTTTAALLAMTLSRLRPSDPVLALDANPDAGTLALRAGRPNGRSVRDLLDQGDDIRRVADFVSWCSVGPYGLQVLASSTDPQVAEAFSASEYARLCDVAERYFPILVSDCGTGIRHDAMAGVLASATNLIIVLRDSVDAAESAARTMQTLARQGHGTLVARAVAVIADDDGRTGVAADRIIEQFGGRVRRWVIVPHDPHLAAGARIDPDRVDRSTMDAMTTLAASVVEDFVGG